MSPAIAIVLAIGMGALGWLAGFSAGVAFQIGGPRPPDWPPEDVQ